MTIQLTYPPDKTDVAFISHERLAEAKPQGYLDVAPELVVEVMSPDETWSDVNDKLEDYFSIDIQQMWVVLATT